MYKDFILNEVEKYGEQEPIRVRDIAARMAEKKGISQKYASQIVSNVLSTELLYRISKGVYCKGMLSKKDLLEPYLQKGFYAPQYKLYKLGLLQKPSPVEIVTNSVKSRNKVACPDIILTLCRYIITEENKDYLQILSVLKFISTKKTDAVNPYEVIRKEVEEKGLSYQKLLSFSSSPQERDGLATLSRQEEYYKERIGWIKHVVEPVCGKYKIACLVLFGSRARGDYRNESDYDFYAKLPNMGFIEEISFREELESVLGKSVDLVSGEIEEKEDYIKEAIQKEGVIVYGNDEG